VFLRLPTAACVSPFLDSVHILFLIPKMVLPGLCGSYIFKLTNERMIRNYVFGRKLNQRFTAHFKSLQLHLLQGNEGKLEAVELPYQVTKMFSETQTSKYEATFEAPGPITDIRITNNIRPIIIISYQGHVTVEIPNTLIIIPFPY
jgi:hypothetical protein